MGAGPQTLGHKPNFTFIKMLLSVLQRPSFVSESKFGINPNMVPDGGFGQQLQYSSYIKENIQQHQTARILSTMGHNLD
jgi:hypothetical protein